MGALCFVWDVTYIVMLAQVQRRCGKAGRKGQEAAVC